MGMFRDKAFDLMNQKQVTEKDMAEACLRYMGEDDIEEMLWNYFNIDLDDNEEENEENE